MRLQRHQSHLTESYGSLEAAWIDIQRKCKSFLKEWLPIFKAHNGGDRIYLYRGVNSINDHFGEKSVRSDRRPLSTDKQISKDVDDVMYKVFKIHGRTASVFCTGNVLDAESYGNLFAIFPVGSYKYLWSPEVGDLFEYLINHGHKKYGYQYDINRKIEIEINRRCLYQNLEWKEILVHKAAIRKKIEESNKKALLRIVRLYKTTDLKNAIRSGHEIMIQCPSYIYVGGSRIPELTNMIRNSL